jgi:hypothetical protein
VIRVVGRQKGVAITPLLPLQEVKSAKRARRERRRFTLSSRALFFRERDLLFAPLFSLSFRAQLGCRGTSHLPVGLFLAVILSEAAAVLFLRPVFFRPRGHGVEESLRDSSWVARIPHTRLASPAGFRGLIDRGLRLDQLKRRNLDIKLFLAAVHHLIRPVHGAEGHGQRAS